MCAVAAMAAGIVLFIAPWPFVVLAQPVSDIAAVIIAADAVAGLVAFAGAVLAANGYAEWRERRHEEQVRQGRLEHPDWVYRIPVAQIANDLAPLMDNLPGKNGGTLRVVGCDGEYISGAPGGRLWLDSLRTWIENGLNVEYVLTAPSQPVVTELNRLKAETESFPGALAILVLPRGNGNDDELESLRAEFKNFHPVLYRGGKRERAMWLEGEHRPGSRYAHNVTWAAPEAVRGKRVAEYERYWDKTGRMIALSGGKLSPAPTARQAAICAPGFIVGPFAAGAPGRVPHPANRACPTTGEDEWTITTLWH